MNNNLFNPNAISVAADWENAKYSDLPTAYKHLSKSCSEKGIEKIEEGKKNKYGSVSFIYTLTNCLTLLQYNRDNKFSKYYSDATKVLCEKVFDEMPVNYKKHKNNDWMLAYESGKVLEAYVSLACAQSVLTPSIPNKSLLLEGIVQYDEKLNKINDKLEVTEISKSILAVISLFLVGKYELALKFLERCNCSQEMKRHRQILTCMANELIVNKNNIISDLKVENEFFSLFNAYRMVNMKATKENINNEHPIIMTPIGNYLFAWLYLKLFRGQETSTWEEMRIIMMS